MAPKIGNPEDVFSLKKGFGDGWLTGSAQYMIRIAILAGFDKADLIKKVAMAPIHGEMTNRGTVLRIMDEMEEEEDA